MTVSIRVWDIFSPWRQRLNPKRDEPLSDTVSTFYMGRYNEGCNATLWNGLGRAVQVDPITPTLKAPGSKRLKLRYD
jgi:hypothetical protein